MTIQQHIENLLKWNNPEDTISVLWYTADDVYDIADTIGLKVNLEQCNEILETTLEYETLSTEVIEDCIRENCGGEK